LLAGCFSKPARPVDGDLDGPPGSDGTPAQSLLTHFNSANNGNASSVTYNVATEADSVLFVSVVIGDSCAGGGGALVQSVMAGPMPLSRVDQVVGLPNCTGGTKTELWKLARPPVDAQLPITVALDSLASSMHSGAFDFIGVDTTDPIRAVAKGSGAETSTTSSLTVDSEPGDLVFDVIGQGKGFTGTGVSQTEVFHINHSMANTLDNSAASTMTGGDLATLVWQFVGPDYWQSIAVALRPAP
jgi:hypothetical protein